MTNQEKISSLLADMKANNGLAPLDLEDFWTKQKEALAAPFSPSIRQCPFGAQLNWECVFDELGLEQDWWRFLYADPQWAVDVSKQYNDLAEKIVGKRLLSERLPDPTRQWKGIKELFDIFESENKWVGGANGSWWLQQAASTPEELSALLDRIEKRLEHLRDFLLPEDWDEQKKRLTSLGCKVPLYRAQRGPCTFACSIFGPENLLMLYYDDPDLLARFRDLITEAILGRAAVLDAEAQPEDVAKAQNWAWYDDNCCLFNPEIYEFFAMPIHRKVFGKYAPTPGKGRYQHSDSAMAHLLPLLSELDLSGTNFGPTLTVQEIRKYLPHAVIYGQLAPFTYSRNKEENMVAEFLRDFEAAKDQRGLVFATAGSINNGSRLTGMRLLMAAIQKYGQF